MFKSKKGFTLIELLVVIAIIGLLATMSIISLNTARSRSRDAKRVSDIKQMQTALEMYYNANNLYPTALASLSPTYMATVPTAPTPHDGPCLSTENTYSYTSNGTPAGGSYSLSYCLGNDTGGVPADVHTATPAGIK